MNIISVGVLLLSTLAEASPILPRNASCPEIFALKISTPGHNYTGLNIISSGQSTYLALAEPIAADTTARFYRNDTTHLYATGFNTSYMGRTQKPPYQWVMIRFLLFPWSIILEAICSLTGTENILSEISLYVRRLWRKSCTSLDSETIVV